jgi:hypothetical protein
VQCSGITGGTIYSLAVSGSNIFAGTTYEGVFISTNNGTTWTQTALNNRDVYSLAVNGNNIFAGTNYYGVYISTNNGTTWTQTALNNRDIFSIAASGNNVLAGTSSYGIYLSTNNGNSWTQTSLNNQEIRSFAVSGNNVFAGTGGNGVYLSTNNGTTWTQTTLNNRFIWSLAASGNNIFAGTDYYGVFYSSNNGSVWIQTALNNLWVYSLALYSSNVIAGTIYDGVYLSTNYGSVWFLKNQGFSTIPTIRALLIANNYIFAGTYGYSIWRRGLTEIIGIKNISYKIPVEYKLFQNYPNPFNPVTKIKFEIPPFYPPLGKGGNGGVSLKIFDILGKEITTLVNEQLSPGTYEVTFDGSNLASGIYFYQLRSGDFVESKKLILIK